MISPESIVALMNEALSLDADAIQSLVSNRVSCSVELSNHPTIVCGPDVLGLPSVGLLGILNGLVAPAKIATIWADGVLETFRLLSHAEIDFVDTVPEGEEAVEMTLDSSE